MNKIVSTVENLLKEDRYTEIKKISTKYFRIHKDKTCEKFCIAHMLLKNANTREYAIMLLETLIYSDSKNYATRLLTSIYMQDGNYERAKELLLYSLEFDDNAIIYLKLSKIAKYEEDYELASSYLKLGLNYDNMDDYAYVIEEILLNLKQEKIDEVCKIINKNKFIKYDKSYYIINDILAIKYGCNLNKIETEYYRFQFEHYMGKRAKYYKGKFYKKVCIGDLFCYCKEKIQNSKPVNSNYFDIYVVEIEYPVGIVDGVETNFVIVRTMLNEKNIVDIIPTMFYVKNKNVVNLEDSYELKYRPKSQIEKFYERYPNNS